MNSGFLFSAPTLLATPPLFSQLSIPPPQLGAALPLQGGLRLGGGREGSEARLAGTADTAPALDQAPVPEQVRLHVQPIEAVQVPGGVLAGEGYRAHAVSLEIVQPLTL
jgi:hypothetical protein